MYFSDRGGWEKWFLNSSDPQTNKLLKKVQLVSDVASGIRNTTKAFFLLPFAFLGSKAELEYIIQASFSQNKKYVYLRVIYSWPFKQRVIGSSPGLSKSMSEMTFEIHIY